MRALIVHELGAAPAPGTRPFPEPGPGEVRVRIAACGLNFADLLMIGGTYQDRVAPPFVPGMEIAGTVDAAGPGVTALAPGARVAVAAGTGGLAEYGVFPAARCTPVPEGISLADAAALQIVYGTAHLALTRRARLAPGETLVVLGAAGGTGLAAVETGRLLGARVIAVARGAERMAAARAAGAETAIDAETPDLRAALKAAGGADVIFDPVGGAAADAAMGALRPEGRYLVIGFASGDVPRFASNRLLVKNVDVIGFWWGGYEAFRPAAMAESLSAVFGWAAGGRLSAHVSNVLPFERAAEGLALLRDRKATGKVVIAVSPEAMADLAPDLAPDQAP
jgi:NADPH2:quinone reductase